MKWFFAILVIGTLVGLIIARHQSNPEARRWLEKNHNPMPLAGNRFKDKQDAQQFVELLYRKGAKRVEVSADAIYDDASRIAREGGPYADALLISLPRDKAPRKALFVLFQTEAARQGMIFNEQNDVQRNQMMLWWD